MVAKLPSFFQRHATFLAIFVLALLFRLLALLLFRPGGFIADASDYDFYYLWGQQIPQGYETFVNLWTAYPPLFPALMLPIFEWSSRIPPWVEPRLFFHLLFGLLLVLFESGNLILVYRLALKLGYPVLGHSSVIVAPLLHPFLFYALLFTPVYTLLGWFEAMPLFFMLWGLDLLLSKRPVGWVGSAVMAALGFLTKLTPALLVPIAVRWLGSRLSWQAIKQEWFNPQATGNLLRPTLYTVLFVAIVLGGGYWLVGGHTELALSSFQVNALRPPWESVWALLVGNYDWGRVPVDMRNLAALAAPPATPQLPWGWITLAFGLLYLWLYTRRYDWNNPRTPVVFAAISVLWLFLYSKGWSPQFLVWILAFVVLLLPSWHGLALSMGLSILNIIESPIFFTMLGNEEWILTGVILLRTALLLTLAGALLGQIWPTPHRQWQRFTAAVTALLLLITVVGIMAGLPRAARAYAEQRLADHPCRAAIVYLQEQAAWPERRLVSDQIAIWRDLYPWLRQSYQIQIIDGYDAHDRPWETMIAERLAHATGNEPFWWVTYSDQPSRAAHYFAQPEVQILEEAQFGACRVVRVMQVTQAPLAVAQVAGGPIHLAGVALDSAKVGAALHLVLYWQAATPVTESYTVFVHLLDAAGQLVAQQDNLPVTGLAPTDTWQPRTLIRDPYRLAVPETAAPGTYQLQVGLYTAAGRVSLITAAGTNVDHLSYAVEVQ
jgi:hypothetical protein